MSTEPVKICTVCRTDCSTRKRLRKPDGTYVCADCVQSQRAAPSASSSSPSRSAPATNAPQVGATLTPGPHDNPIELDRTPDPDSLRPLRVVRNIQCPSCMHTLGHDSVICINCGYDRRTGLIGTGPDAKAVKRKPSSKLTCAKCEYDLTGLRSNVCPECGTKFSLSDRKHRRRSDEAKRVVRMAYLVPAWMFGISMAIGLMLIAARDKDAKVAGFYALFVVARALVATGVYFMMCMLWVGFDAPLHLTFLRLSGIASVMSLLWLIQSLTIGWFPPLGLLLYFIYVALLKWLMDFEEFSEAFVMAIVTGIGMIAVSYAMVQLFS